MITPKDIRNRMVPPEALSNRPDDVPAEPSVPACTRCGKPGEHQERGRDAEPPDAKGWVCASCCNAEDR